jgi:uncharacterized damage-inducible protein DinB
VEGPVTDDALANAFISSFETLHSRLRKALEGLDMAQLDRAPAPETNSIAVLVTHACASELDWLHTAAGRTMQRDRDAEFRARGQSAEQVAAAVERAATEMPALVRAAVSAGADATRRSRAGRELSAAWCLLHALDHLAEHVGHAELTRQLVAR